MQSNMSVVKSVGIAQINKSVKKSITVGVVKKKSIKKNNLSNICCGDLCARGTTMTMFRHTTMGYARVM